MADRLREVIIFRDVSRQQKEWRGVENFGFQQVRPDPYPGAMNRDRKHDAGVGEEVIQLIAKSDLQRLLLITLLIVISFLPKNANAEKVLLQFIGGAKVGARHKTHATAVSLERLIDGKYH